jgi:alanine dehydrogenase
MGATRERKAMATVVGIPKEIKDMEGRVSMQPDGVAELVHHGHDVYVQAGAGEGAGFSDEEYEEGGARLVDGPDEVFESSDLIVKVKEPVPEEYDRFREGHQLFTYLHLAADKGLTAFLMERRINSIAYETVETSDGSLPLLTPMSEVGGCPYRPRRTTSRVRREGQGCCLAACQGPLRRRSLSSVVES